MKHVLFFLAVILFSAASARAQFEGAIGMTVRSYYEADSAEVLYVMSVKNDMMAVTTTGGPAQAQGGSFIIRGDKRVMWIVNDEAKSYVEFPLIDDTTAKKPSPAKGNRDAGPLLKRSGKSKKILGYQCDEWTGSNEEESTSIWASAKMGKVYDGLFKSLNQLNRSEEGAQTGSDWQAELVRLKLFPLSITTRRDGAIYETQEVTSISSKPVPASAFEPPAKYEKQTMENQFQEMLRQMQEQMKNGESSQGDTSGR